MIRELFLSDWVGRVILALIGILLVAIVALLGVAADDMSKPCLRAEWVHHDSWLQLMPVGKVLVPITHPETTSCDCVARGERFAKAPLKPASCGAK